MEGAGDGMAGISGSLRPPNGFAGADLLAAAFGGGGGAAFLSPPKLGKLKPGPEEAAFFAAAGFLAAGFLAPRPEPPGADVPPICAHEHN